MDVSLRIPSDSSRSDDDGLDIEAERLRIFVTHTGRRVRAHGRSLTEKRKVRASLARLDWLAGCTAGAEFRGADI